MTIMDKRQKLINDIFKTTHDPKLRKFMKGIKDDIENKQKHLEIWEHLMRNSSDVKHKAYLQTFEEYHYYDDQDGKKVWKDSIGRISRRQADKDGLIKPAVIWANGKKEWYISDEKYYETGKWTIKIPGLIRQLPHVAHIPDIAFWLNIGVYSFAMKHS
jgi:hypothetical protein